MRGAHQASSRDSEDAPSHYRRLLEHLIDQLDDQLAPGPSIPVLIPTVGFGDQSRRVLDHTIRQLARQRSATPISVVILVNRPQARLADDTFARARESISAVASPAVSFAVAEVAMPTRIRLGELRQLLLDAVLCVQGLSLSDTGFVIADDDLVHVAEGSLDSLHQAVTGPAQADAAVGPVLFDSPTNPAPMLPVFFLSDAFRALLAARFIQNQAASSDDCHAAIQFRHYAESIALSGNLIVRGSALIEAGGFAPYNEITGLIRGVHGLPRVRAGRMARLVGTWDFHRDDGDVLVDLYNVAMRISARRALVAYLTSGVPSVAQWRACRFRSSRIDPVRIVEPTMMNASVVSELGAHETRTLTEQVSGALTTTLRYFPPAGAVIGDCLAALGLPARSVSLSLASDSAYSAVRIRDIADTLERLRTVQELVTRNSAQGSDGDLCELDHTM